MTLAMFSVSLLPDWRLPADPTRKLRAADDWHGAICMRRHTASREGALLFVMDVGAWVVACISEFWNITHFAACCWGVFVPPAGKRRRFDGKRRRPSECQFPAYCAAHLRSSHLNCDPPCAPDSSSAALFSFFAFNGRGGALIRLLRSIKRYFMIYA